MGKEGDSGSAAPEISLCRWDAVPAPAIPVLDQYVIATGRVILATLVDIEVSHRPDVVRRDCCDPHKSICIAHSSDVWALDNAPRRAVPVFDQRLGNSATGCQKSHCPGIGR